MTGDVDFGWQPIESAPKDTELLVYTRPWGPIIAVLSDEFGEWLSRMQVPVSIREDNELPTHWQPLPEAPDGVETAVRDSPT
ncbi:DUF551 domain-containing protein [Micromonospora sp. STR1s_5]|nr:DUF551 domain-containing protein [Micromonospora sp. STR1s_5]